MMSTISFSRCARTRSARPADTTLNPPTPPPPKVVHCSIHDQGTIYSSHIERPAGTSARTVFVIRLR